MGKSKVENPKLTLCGRCGNHDHIICSLYFPFLKVRVNLCDICFHGLAEGLYDDSIFFKQKRKQAQERELRNG